MIIHPCWQILKGLKLTQGFFTLQLFQLTTISKCLHPCLFTYYNNWPTYNVFVLSLVSFIIATPQLCFTFSSFSLLMRPSCSTSFHVVNIFNNISFLDFIYTFKISPPLPSPTLYMFYYSFLDLCVLFLKKVTPLSLLCFS